MPLAQDGLHIRLLAWTVDTISAAAILAALVGWLPIAAALAGLVWYTIQIWESRTVQHWYENRKMCRKARKIARLKAKEKIIVAQLEALESLRQARVDARDKIELAKVEAAKQVAHETTEVAAKAIPPLL